MSLPTSNAGAKESNSIVGGISSVGIDVCGFEKSATGSGIWGEPRFAPLAGAELIGGANWDATRNRWISLLNSDPGGSIYLHPDLLGGGQALGMPIILAASQGQTLRSLAVLRAVDGRVRIAPGLPAVRLRKRKLVASGGLGVAGQAEASALVDAITKVLDETDQVYFEVVQVGGHLWNALQQYRGSGRVIYPSAPQTHWWLDFPQNPEDYWKKFSKKSRYNLKAQVKKLEHGIRCFRTSQEVPEFLALANQISQKTWQSRNMGLRICNNDQELKSWQLVAGAGAFRSYVLEHRGSPAAFALGIQWKGRFVLEEIGYDPALAEFSPGTVLNYRMVEEMMAAETPATWDFGFGDNEYKRKFGTRQGKSGPVLLVRGGFVPMTATRLAQARQYSGRVVRTAMRTLGLANVLRRAQRKLGPKQ